MHLGVQPYLIVLHALKDIELPKRSGTIEKLGMHPANDALKSRAIVRGRKAAAEDMPVDVELVVFDPRRVVDIERRLFQPCLEDRRDVQPRGDHCLEFLEEVALVILGQTEDGHASDVHRHFRRLQIKKRRVHRGQLLGLTHGPLPANSAAPSSASGVQNAPVLRTSGQDCAFSGAGYAMANGPDRSNCLNSPSGWAKRSATAHNAAGFTPSPT